MSCPGRLPLSSALIFLATMIGSVTPRDGATTDRPGVHLLGARAGRPALGLGHTVRGPPLEQALRTLKKGLATEPDLSLQLLPRRRCVDPLADKPTLRHPYLPCLLAEQPPDRFDMEPRRPGHRPCRCRIAAPRPLVHRLHQSRPGGPSSSPQAAHPKESSSTLVVHFPMASLAQFPVTGNRKVRRTAPTPRRSAAPWRPMRRAGSDPGLETARGSAFTRRGRDVVFPQEKERPGRSEVTSIHEEAPFFASIILAACRDRDLRG